MRKLPIVCLILFLAPAFANAAAHIGTGGLPSSSILRVQPAVARGLDWLSKHQYADGGWSFDHTKAPQCDGKCENPGTLSEARNGATALAILPFLACGITHEEGRLYKDKIRAGLYFLIDRMEIDEEKNTGSFYEDGGTMYSHALATLCLTEAYNMTLDDNLKKPAQKAVNFIVAAQSRESGGWQDNISVTALQLLAIKSGRMASLSIPDNTVKNAMKFLDATPPGEDAACTAAGFLCWTIYGWKNDHPEMEKSVRWLAERGPAEDDVRYNLYGQQVMHDYDGPLWRKWNIAMREQLVETQIADKTSHEFGSWWHGSEKPGYAEGGRLYETAMSILTLEVYYRYLPIWSPPKAKEITGIVAPSMTAKEFEQIKRILQLQNSDGE